VKIFKTRPAISVFFLSLLLLSPLAQAYAETWQADFKIRVLSPKVKPIFYAGKLAVHHLKARIETGESKEINLYNFETLSEVRIFPEDQIYFKKPLSLAKQVKAAKQGWGPMPASFHEKSVLLRKGQFKGRAARLYFVTIHRGNQTAYLMRWMSDEAAPLPLRAIYTSSGRETIIVDFDPSREAPPAPDAFDPPKDYLSLNPF